LAHGTVVALPERVPIEVVLGRSLACCAHPAAAWRQLPTSGRVLLIAAYFSAGYLASLLALIVIV
jgi:hypothetical protein